MNCLNLTVRAGVQLRHDCYAIADFISSIHHCTHGARVLNQAARALTQGWVTGVVGAERETRAHMATAAENSFLSKVVIHPVINS